MAALPHRFRWASGIGLTCVALIGVCAAAGSAATGACKPGKVVLRGLKPGKAGPAKLCLPALPSFASPADASVAAARLARNGGLFSARQRRLMLPPKAAERAFARARDAQLRAGAVPVAGRGLVRARAAGAAGTTTSHSKVIPEGPRRVGSGLVRDTSTTSSGRSSDGVPTRYTHTSVSRHEIFGPTCADPSGTVVTTIKLVDTDTHIVERNGKRTFFEVSYRDTGKLTGIFSDEFALKGPLKLELDFVVETRSHTEDAGTGKVTSHDATKTQRVSATAELTPSVDHFGGAGAITDALGGLNVTGAVGPKGVLTVNDFEANGGSLYLMLAATTWLTEVQAMTVFAESIGSMKSGACVDLTASPSSLVLPRGQSDATTLTPKGHDDQRPLPSLQVPHITFGKSTVTPTADADVKGPESGVRYQVTGDGAKGRLHITAYTRRGVGYTDVDIIGCGGGSGARAARSTATARALACTGRLGGTFTATADLTGALGGTPVTETFNGVLVLAPVETGLPSVPGYSLPTFYRVESGSVHVKARGVLSGGCQLLAEGEVDLLSDVSIAQGLAMTLTPGAPATYALTLAAPLQATIPGELTGCPSAAGNGPTRWSIATGVPSLIQSSPSTPLGPGGAVGGSASGTPGPGGPQQTWSWDLQPQ